MDWHFVNVEDMTQNVSFSSAASERGNGMSQVWKKGEEERERGITQGKVISVH